MTRRSSSGSPFDYDTDPVLAETARRLGIRAPQEEIREIRLYPGRGERPTRVAMLACGHGVPARGRTRRMRCPACQRMIDAGGDYVGFRHPETKSE